VAKTLALINTISTEFIELIGNQKYDGFSLNTKKPSTPKMKRLCCCQELAYVLEGSIMTIVPVSNFNHTHLFLFIAIALTFSFMSPPSYADGVCPSSPSTATLYKHSNYKGPCVSLPIGEYIDSDAMQVDNDSVSSLKVGREVALLVCKHSWRGDTGIYRYGQVEGLLWSQHFKQPYLTEEEATLKNMMKRNKCEFFTDNRKSLKGTRIGNDKISAAFVMRREAPESGGEFTLCKPNANQIAVYEHDNYHGNCRILNRGSYANSKQLNMKNDSISSIDVGSNVQAIACEHGNFRGRCQTITHSIKDLKHSNVGGDAITSIKVLHR
jgi:hypothetical protein